MPRCHVLELEPLDLDLLGVEVLLGGRRDRGLDIIVDSEGGLLGQILAGLLCGPDAPFGSLGELLSALGNGLSALEAVQDAAGGSAGAQQDDEDQRLTREELDEEEDARGREEDDSEDDDSGSREAGEDSPANKPPAKRKGKAKARPRS